MRLTAKWVNPPKNPDGKYGNIKTQDDITVMVPIDRLGQFQRHGTYDVPTANKVWGSGIDAREVIVAVGDALPVGGVQERPSGGYQAASASGGSDARPLPQSFPAASAGPARPNPDARMIFATGVVGRAMGSGKFEAAEIATLLELALAAYDRREAAAAAPEPEGMND